MSIAKKIWKFISSMQFAIILLVVLATACSVASLITQGQSYSWYAQRYSERAAALIMALRLDDAFHSGWFLIINLFLCVNLLLCHVLRLPQLVRRTRREADPVLSVREQGDVATEHVAAPEAVFRRLGMPAPVRVDSGDGGEAMFASKHHSGLWGAWVCHLGILLLIAGFALGQMTHQEYTVYGVPGQSKPIGETGYVLTIDAFSVELHDDGSVKQYTSDITVRDAAGDSECASISVNHPAELFGMKYYQNSTGWAAAVSVTEGGDVLQQEILCAGESLAIADKPDLVMFLNAIYPDYVSDGGHPSTASNSPNNPAYLYSVFYQGQIIGMNVLMDGEVISVDDYEIAIAEPQSYTLIQIKSDRFAWLALLGGLTALLGLALAFYVQPTKVWAVREPDGGWTMHGRCRKGGAVFRERFAKAAGADDHGAGEGTKHGAD